MSGKVFVTVGSTSFDELTSTVCSKPVLASLSSKGFKLVTIQTGKGKPVTAESSDIEVTSYPFKDDISDDIKSASLVISHAGAGSILQALENQKLLIVVINDKLMNNHQEELAKELSSNNYLTYCYCNNLQDRIENLRANQHVTYLPADPEKFLNHFDQVMGYG